MTTTGLLRHPVKNHSHMKLSLQTLIFFEITIVVSSTILFVLVKGL
nr:unnamed protein product [Callosobruchus chinensis]CAH7727346.1 unnamed protein product [Callosobruchus chinensis]CAH7740943.1 unnamed protein product [Callosobruchus chinensis]